MNVKELLIGFVMTFGVTLVVSAIVTFLWSLIFHGAAAIDWETSFRFAIILGIALPLARAWEGKREIA